MAAGFVSLPGSKFGPCNESCEHKQCRAVLQIAGAPCRLCGEAIGYNRRYYDETQPGSRLAGGALGPYVHELCELEQMEKERGRKRRGRK